MPKKGRAGDQEEYGADTHEDAAHFLGWMQKNARIKALCAKGDQEHNQTRKHLEATAKMKGWIEQLTSQDGENEDK
jgi:hypothetical protein